ncbi:integrase catalytic domain-containing protein [Trichonephila clavata]|uniref:Integrase catalytic domain-containing protein n=1 Tax=Trichonephila clavata TaxID=2740835 RepID=A0A8X6LMC4_TRICU|nr:integrase catalytic domain-containing protein [Trichonephila clavata]
MAQNFIAKKRIIWKNIIVKSPWWEGFYERLVRSVKESLHKILGKDLLSYEEMRTILTEIEAILNLSYVHEESDEPRPLSPKHFLNCGQNQPTYPVMFAEILENASKKSSLLKR